MDYVVDGATQKFPLYNVVDAYERIIHIVQVDKFCKLRKDFEGEVTWVSVWVSDSRWRQKSDGGGDFEVEG